MSRRRQVSLMASILVLWSLCPWCFGQMRHLNRRPSAPNVLVPQLRGWALASEGRQAIALTDVEVRVDIVETTATTTVEMRVENRTDRRQEAELVVPVPEGVVVRGFAYDGPCGEVTAQVLPREEARRIYEGLVARIRDPALVEFIGYNLIRSSVFPVEARGRQKIRLTYEHLLEADGDRVDYVLPRTEALGYEVPWKVTATIKAKHPIATVYSPSHKLEIERISDRQVSVHIATKAMAEPGPFRFSYLLEGKDVTASLLAYPDPKVGGGYFLLLAGMPCPKATEEKASIPREVILVVDRSGSMRNEKLAQVKEAALQILGGLQKGESFNIIIYNDSIQSFSQSPVVKTPETEAAARRYIEGVTATGGTNIHDALQTALSQKPTAGTLPIVLFLTDGLPTVGQTSELAIRELVLKANSHKRRVFTFGVGFDVNAPLLEKLASASGGRAEFVLPQEDVEVKVGRVFRQLSGPLLADLELRVVGCDGDPALGRVRDLLPDKLPDLFEGDRLVLLGQYVGAESITFELTGNYLGDKRTFRSTFDFEKASTKNGFVPRLWASRKIAALIDAVRQMGADPSARVQDPKVQELIDGIVHLSKEFGILTEYTAFLAREGTDLADAREMRRQAGENLSNRAMKTRSGMAAVNQSLNAVRQQAQSELNYRNSFYDQQLNEVTINTVQQVNDRTYYRRGRQWVDSRLIGRAGQAVPKRTIAFGSPEYFDLARRLARENQQGSIALVGDVLLEMDGDMVLIQGPNGN
jgi:Ca-activated chloride channel family protein